MRTLSQILSAATTAGAYATQTALTTLSSTVNVNYTSLDGRMTLAEGNISVLQGQVSTLNSNVAALQTGLADTNVRVSNLETAVAALQNINFFDMLAGSPFVDMAALEAVYPTDAGIPANVDSVLVGATMYLIVPLGEYPADQTTVPGWTTKALYSVAQVGDITGLQTQVNAMQIQVTNNTNAISTETTDRIAADNGLQSQITAEANARIAADDAIQVQIDTINGILDQAVPQ